MRILRQVIIDAAREVATQKRGGGVRALTFDDNCVAAQADAHRLLEIDEHLDQLAEVDEKLVRVVECRFFSGLTEAETAETLGVSVSTVQRAWRHARALLRAALGEA